MDLVALLEQLTQPDTEKVKQATKQLQTLGVTNDFLLNLFHVLSSQQNEQIRVLASVLLRRKILKSPSAVSPEVHERLKQYLLIQVQQEKNERIQKALFELIGTIAKQDLQPSTSETSKKKHHHHKNKHNAATSTGWKELLHMCGTLVQSTDLSQLELGMCLFGTLASYCGEFVLEHWPHTFNLVLAMLKNRQSPVVCEQALIILTNLVKNLHQKSHVQTVIDLIPIADQATEYLFTQLKGEKMTNLFDFYEALLDCELPVIGPHLQSIIAVCLRVAMNTDSQIPESVRYNGLSILAEICRQKKKVLLKNEALLASIIQALLEIIGSATLDARSELECDEDEEEPAVVAGANHVLEAMSYHLTAEKFVPLVISQVEPMLKSSVVNQRKAAYYVLSGIIDGCCDYINNNYLTPYMTALILGLEDSNSDVSSAALLALGETCAVLEGEISKHANDVLRILMRLMVKPENMTTHNLKVIRIYYALEELISILDAQHEDAMTELLKVLFHVNNTTTNTKIQELVLAVYPAIGVVFKSKFAPLFDAVIAQLSPHLSQKPNDDTMPMFSTSLKTLASLCRSVGTDQGKVILLQALDFSLNLFNEVDEPEFRAAVFNLCGAAGYVLTNDLNSTYIAKIIGFLLESLKSNEWIENPETTEKRKLEWLDEEDIGTGDSIAMNGEKQEESDEDTDDELDEADLEERLSIENAHIEEKASAVEALGDLIEHCTLGAWPFLKDIVDQIKNLMEFPNIHCAQNALQAVGQLLCSIYKMAGQTLAPNEKQVILEQLDILLLDLIPALCEMINTSTSRTLAQVALDTIKSVLEELKAYMLRFEQLLQKIAQCTQKVLSYKTQCQKDNEGEEQEEDERADGRDDAEYDSMLIETGGDVLPVLTSIAAAGSLPFFSSYLHSIIPKLQRRLRQKAAVSERSFVVGVLAETVQNMTEAMLLPFLQSLYTMFYEYLVDVDEEVRTNACFGIGVLCLTGKQHLLQYYESILARLSTVLLQETNRRAIDNICSCLCRLIIVSPAHVHLPSVLPVLFQHLPIREDFAEVGSVFLCLTMLYSQHFSQVEAFLPKSIEMAISVIDDERLTPETIQVIREFLHSIYLTHGAAFVQIMNSLEESLRVKLSQHMATIA